MTVTNRIGRPLLAAMFIHGGTDQLRRPETKVDKARSVTDPIQARAQDLPVPEQTVDLVRINGGVQVVAGSLLALNKAPRLAALALAGSLVPTTLAGHRFWEIEDEQERAQQRAHFLKNTAMLGGLVIAVGDTGGRPSAAWQARRTTRKAIDDTSEAISDTVSDATSAIGGVTGEVTGKTRRFRRRTSGLGEQASGVAEQASDRVAESLASTRDAAGPAFHDASAAASDAISEASDALSDAIERAQPVLEAAADETRSRYRDLRKAARPMLERNRTLVKRARPAIKRARPIAEKVRAESDRLAAAAAQAGAQSRVAARNAVERGAVAIRSTAA